MCGVAPLSQYQLSTFTMCGVAPLSQYQLSTFTMLALEALNSWAGDASAFFFVADLSCMFSVCCSFWGHSAAQWPSCLNLLQGNLFCAVSFSFCGLTGIYFHWIRLLVIFMCNERCSFGRCQFVSSQFNCTELLNEKIHRLYASRNGIPDILEIVVFFTKCGQNPSSQHTFRQRIFTVLHQFVVYIDRVYAA